MEELAPTTQLLARAAGFYQLELHRRREGMDYLAQRGVYDTKLIKELGIGYARGGNLGAYLQGFGYSLERVLEAGLINPQGADTFCRRVIFPCRQQDRIDNLYGRSIGRAFSHRLLPRPKGGLLAWESLHQFRDIILVEGLFDLAVLWQAGFRNTTCAIGTHLTPTQLAQLREDSDRCVYIAFDQDGSWKPKSRCSSRPAGPKLCAATATVPIIFWPISTLPFPACTSFHSSAAIPISLPGSASSASNIPCPGTGPVTCTCLQSAAYCVT